MNGEVQGVDELKKELAKLKIEFGNEIATALFKGGRIVQSATIKRIQKPEGMGIWTTRKHKGQAAYDHLASAPGQAPNSDTGELVRGIQVEAKDKDVYVGVEKSQDKKALALEFGSEDGTLKPRPFLNPSLEENRDRIRKLILEASAKAIENANRKARKQAVNDRKAGIKKIGGLIGG